MTTVIGTLGVGPGVPPARLPGAQAAQVQVRSWEIVTTDAGKTMLPLISRTPVNADGTWTVEVDPLPFGFAHVFEFYVPYGRYTSPPRFVRVPATGSYRYEDLEDVFPPNHAGWGVPSWIAEVADRLSGGGGGGSDPETVRDIIGAALVAGAGIAINVNDAANTITIGATGLVDDETVRDLIGTTLVAGAGIVVDVNDAGDTITISRVPVTKADVGLGNVDNTSDASKPVSTAQATALAAKAPLANPTFTGTVSGVTKAHVGLGNVDNTADTDKPLSVAQSAALAAKADLVGGVIPTAQLPAITITEFLGSVASQSAMLALTGQKGDWCIRTDLASTWVITGTNPAVIGGWTQIVSPTGGAPVTDVNGKVGSVVLSASDVGAPADADVVKLAGVQTITGGKTFTASPTVPVPTSDGHAARKKYVDDAVAGVTATQNTLYRRWNGTAYPALPSSQPAGVEMILFLGPVQPTAENTTGGIPSYVGSSAGKTLAGYEYWEFA